MTAVIKKVDIAEMDIMPYIQGGDVFPDFHWD